MADFISVIRRAVDGLSNNTPEMRAKVYEKARSAVARQLENMSPRPPEEMLRRQMDKLEAAIQEVEAEHIEALPEEPEAALLEEELGIAPAASAHAEPEPEPEPEPEEEPEARQEPAAEAAHDVHAVHEEPVEEQAEEEAYEEPAAPSYPVYPVEAAREEEVEHPAEEPAEPAYHYEEAEPEHVAWGAEGEHAAAEPAAEEADHGEPWLHAGEETPAEPVSEPAIPAEPESPQPVTTAEPEVEEPVAEEPSAVAPAVWSESIPEYDRTYGDWAETAREEEKPHEYEAPETAAAAMPASAMPEVTVGPWPAAEQPQPVEPPAAEAPAGKAPSHDIDLLDWDTTAYQPPAGVDGSKGGEAQNFDDFADWYAAVATPAAGAAVEACEAAEGRKADQTASETASKAAGTVPPAAKTAGKPYRIEQTKRRNYAPIAVGVLVVAALAGGGYELWANRDAVSTFVSDSVNSLTAMVAGDGTEPTTPPAENAANGTPPAADTKPEAGAETKAPDAKVPMPPEEGAVTGQKFTQRLMADGTEVDEGAGTAGANTGGEGRSVSEQNVAGTQPDGEAGATAGGTAPGATTTPPVDMSKPIAGEKAFLYEEKLGQTSPTAITGAVEWTALNDTSENGRPNPAIQGKLSIPDRGLSALITIRRNADNSLPASHLIEVVFSVPADFEGGAIDNVQRIAMKRTEQDRGDPLVAVSAKITDDSYLIALNDFQDVVARNLDLLRTRNWIDIPVTYRNGRRALLTLDKGTAGVAVFDEVMKQWAALDNGNGGG
ncbi:hypothetical protein [Ciceribacter sp. RN22]|uniref:hypothetical protein n=1 Tax=Ciceribacter sp. RN22 TaxID=2954932 RepID=UPI002093E486|nr:hypothetical protein [Ciceribacter sp. RN22]MCO6179266.1 hypothetical protein [Ciceribacter sp. RN22]